MKNLVKVLIGTAMLSFAVSQSAFSMIDTENDMFRAAGNFEVGNGDMLVVGHHRTDRAYQVCVRNARHVVPLKVIHDGKETTVMKGDCENFDAKSISITPAKKLPRDMALSGWYRHVLEKQAHTQG